MFQFWILFSIYLPFCFTLLDISSTISFEFYSLFVVSLLVDVFLEPYVEQKGSWKEWFSKTLHWFITCKSPFRRGNSSRIDPTEGNNIETKFNNIALFIFVMIVIDFSNSYPYLITSLFNRYFSSAHYMNGIILTSLHTVVNRTTKSLSSSALLWWSLDSPRFTFKSQ